MLKDYRVILDRVMTGPQSTPNASKLYYIMLYYVISNYVSLCYIMLNYIMLCYAMLCYGMLLFYNILVTRWSLVACFNLFVK